ncbi:kelch domain-containing protein 10-like [Macrosteles quadrilineatus]|uniref:kelch domain-containing protein 10-like n=1 Tax=Macrosteles quadrilineatus TaxID=74068 RepID=UPI0023E12FC3|nr:kelch domain-containing protein 10-like [Macrosteles quadrilineatus]
MSPVRDREFKFKAYKLTSKYRMNDRSGSRDKDSNVWPKPRSGHRIVCDNVNVYSFGGYNPSLSACDESDLLSDNVWSDSKPLFKELWKYNIATGIWTKMDVELIPDILASNAVLLSGNILMVYGGTGVPFGANCSNDLFICDLSKSNDLKFEVIVALGNSPQPQYGQAILLIDDYLYTIGGTTGFQYSCDIHRLSLKDAMWEAVYTCKGSDIEPTGRYRHEVAYFEQRIYLLGGGTAHEAFDFQTVFAFNLTTNTWEKMNTRPDDKAREVFPSRRRCHSCVQRDHFVFIIGGFTGQLILKDIWRLDLKNYQWEKLSKMSLNRGVYFHSSCLTPSGKVITFGGIVQSENTSERSADVHMAWLCIPKLKEICWEAVISYHRDLDTMTEEQLHALGLPLEYINRLDLKRKIRM